MPATALAHLPASGSPELLFLLFHGVGATAAHMTPLAQRLVAEYPQAAVICLDAPDPFDGVPGGTSNGNQGWQWFSVRGIDDSNRAARVAAALPRFVATVRALQAQFALGWERTALAGFSQGAILSLEAVQAEPALASRVLAFSGRHATPPGHAPADTTLHFFHGLEDSIVPFAPAVDSAQRLIALGGDVTADVLPGIGHELHTELIEKAIEQLRNFLPKKVWRDAMSEAPLMPRVASSDELGDAARED